MSRKPPELSPADHAALDPLLTALTAPPTSSELDGIAPTLVALRTAQVTSVPSSPPRRRASMITTLAGAKLGATIAGIAVGLGGTATVVYVSANVPLSSTHATASPTTSDTADPTETPDPTETATETETPDPTETATETPDPTDTPDATETPDATDTPDATATAAGPDATGPAAHGLCTAWKNLAAHAGTGKAMDSIAFANLAKAAGGADQVAAYCATVPAPGESGQHATGKPATASHKPATTSTARPQTARSGRSTAKATGRPATTQTARPAAAAAAKSHPTGRH